MFARGAEGAVWHGGWSVYKETELEREHAGLMFLCVKALSSPSLVCLLITPAVPFFGLQETKGKVNR